MFPPRDFVSERRNLTVVVGRGIITRVMAAGQRAYTQQDRAEALAAMTLEGKPADRVAVELGIPGRTVAHWAQKWREVTPEQSHPAIEQDDVDLALRFAGVLHKAAEYIEQDDTGERAFKSMIASNAVRGTAIDKILKRQQGPNTVNVGVFIIE